ncbi:MAG: hypothetical protein ACR2P2_15710 [Nakamurella sp.]
MFQRDQLKKLVSASALILATALGSAACGSDAGAAQSTAAIQPVQSLASASQVSLPSGDSPAAPDATATVTMESAADAVDSSSATPSDSTEDGSQQPASGSAGSTDSTGATELTGSTDSAGATDDADYRTTTSSAAPTATGDASTGGVVNDATMKPFVGYGETGDQGIVISNLGVISIEASTGETTTLQAKEVSGKTVTATVTASTLGATVGSSMSFTLKGSTLLMKNGSFDFTAGPISTGFADLVGKWDGHGRGMTISADGKVQISVRAGSSTAHHNFEGFLRTMNDGSQTVIVYLSEADDYPVGSAYPISIKNGVVTFNKDLTFCGATNPNGVCGA